MNPIFYENMIIRILFTNKECRDLLYPYITSEIFEEYANQHIIDRFLKFKGEYEDYPTAKQLGLYLKNEDIYDHLKECLNMDVSEYNDDYIMDTVEEFFKEKLLWNDINSAVENLKEGEIDNIATVIDKMRESISFTFDTTVGLDYAMDGEKLYSSLHDKDKVVPSGITNIDKIIEGGFHEKSLTLFLAETNMGKSLIKCGLATNALLQNKNVLYVTLEMSEAKIAERLTANLMDVELNHLKVIKKETFLKKHEEITKSLKSNLIIKEYPNKGANTNRLRNLLKELKMKKKFIPDVIFVDYLGIMSPNALRTNDNTNTQLKNISEELRGLAVECGIPIVSALQTNRGGFGTAEIDLTDTADSIGTTATADIIFGVTQTEEMRMAGIYTFILLKNRYGINKVKTSVGVDYPKMRIHDVDNEFEEEEPIKNVNVVDDAVLTIQKNLKGNKKMKQKKVIDLEF